MSQKLPTIWPLDPHTGAKHIILKNYFGAWISIISQYFNRAIFVDGFCGPGEYQSGEQGSPIITIQEATQALQKAPRVKTPFRLDMYFIDEDKDRIGHLKNKMSGLTPDPRIILHQPVVGEFEVILPSILEEVRRHPDTVPMLVFVDPFGVKGCSLEILQSVLGNTSAEVFMLFDVDGVNRLLHAEEMMKKVFGDDAVIYAQNIRLEQDPKKKIQRIRKLHQDVVAGSGRAAKYYLPFKLQATGRRVLYDLVFLSNNDRGFEEMKNAMWKADESGSFHFVDSEYDELSLTLLTAPEELWQLLLKKYSGKKISGLEVDRFVRFETRFRSPHKTQALKNHESEDCPPEQRITVVERQRKFSYPDRCKIQFP